MENRYRTNLKKVFLTDQELATLHDHIGQSRYKNFSAYARKVLLNPNMTFLIIDTSNYEDLVFELRRIGNNINQIARAINTDLVAREPLDAVKLLHLLIGIDETLKQLRESVK